MRVASSYRSKGKDKDTRGSINHRQAESERLDLSKGHTNAVSRRKKALRRSKRKRAWLAICRGGRAADRFDAAGEHVKVQYFLVRMRKESPETDGRDKRWMPMKKAESMLTYENMRGLLREARQLLEGQR